MKKILYFFIVMFIILFFSVEAQAVFDESKLIASAAAPFDNYGASASIDGDTAVVGAPDLFGLGPGTGAAYVYVRSGTLWHEQAMLIPSDGDDGDRFGWSVAISGDTAVVGAPHTEAAYIFVRSGEDWTEQAKLVAMGGMSDDEFGRSVAIHGETVVVGAPSPFISSTEPGAAYVFVRNGTLWSEQKKLTASDGMMRDRFGHSVAVYGDSVVVGAPWHDEMEIPNSGAAYAFMRSGGDWSEEKKLIADVPAAGDLFGDSVSLSGDTVLIGSVNDDDRGRDSGSAYVFVRSASVWDEEAKLTASDGAIEDRFGISLSLDGDIAVIGAFLYDEPAPGESSDTYAYVFQRDEDDWTEKEKLTTGSGSQINGSEAQFVGVSGCSVIVGSELDDDGGTDAGAAYIFALDSCRCPCVEPPADMVSWWNMNEVVTEEARDSVGSNNGVWVNFPTPVPGIIKGALQFDGLDSYVEVPNDPSLNFGMDRDFSIDAWIKPNVLVLERGGAIVDKRDPITGRGYSLRLIEDHLAFVISDGSSASMSFVDTDPLPIDSWSLIAVTVNRAEDEGKVYVNGTLRGTFSPSDTAIGTIDNTQPLYIANNSEDELFAGVVDEVEIFERALKPAEIERIHEAFTGGKCYPCVPHAEEMVAWWPFDETGGIVSADIFGPHESNQVGGPTPSPGKVDVSLAFNGFDQHVKVADHDSLDFGTSESFSIDAWIRPEADDSYGVIVDKLDPTTGVGYRLFILNQTLMFTISDGSGSPFSYISPSLIESGDWSFVAVTVDRDLDEGTVYINGDIDEIDGRGGHFTPSETALGSISNTWPLFMGGNPSGDNFRGRLDEVEIFNKALTEDDVKDIYNADLEGKCKPGPDLIHHSFLPIIAAQLE